MAGMCCRCPGSPARVCPPFMLCLTLPLSWRCASTSGPRGRVCLHAAQCLCPLHPHCAVGRAWREGQHQLCQDWLLCHRDIPHEALLWRESPQVGSGQHSGCVFLLCLSSLTLWEETRCGRHTCNPNTLEAGIESQKFQVRILSEASLEYM